jgi:hypothetical protein
MTFTMSKAWLSFGGRISSMGLLLAAGARGAMRAGVSPARCGR